MRRELPTFRDVLAAVVHHVETTGHQDIRLHDDPRANLTGYCCNNCPPRSPVGWYMAPVSTVEAVQGKYKNIDLKSSKVRASLVRDLIKMGLHAREVYRPTVWERILKVS